MNFTPQMQKAINIASIQHIGQTRKAGNIPYITHPFSVGLILSVYTNDEATFCAGLLHDVLEDTTGYSYDDMIKDFGPKIAQIVKDVSEDKDPSIKMDEKATWLERKQQYIDHLKTATDEAIFVSVADKIHNLSSMIEAYNLEGENLWSKFNAPLDKKLWFYEEVLKIAEARIKNGIVGELRGKLEESRCLFLN